MRSRPACAGPTLMAFVLSLGMTATDFAWPGSGAWLVPTVQAQARWAGFRGPAAGAVPDDPSLPDTWSETENVMWVADVPGLGWSSPIVWDDHVFLTTAVSTGQERQPPPGLYDPGSDFGSTRSTAEHRWIVYDLDLATGRRPLGAGAPSRHSAHHTPREEQLRLRDPGHRRPPRLRVFREPRAGRGAGGWPTAP